MFYLITAVQLAEPFAPQYVLRRAQHSSHVLRVERVFIPTQGPGDQRP